MRTIQSVTKTGSHPAYISIINKYMSHRFFHKHIIKLTFDGGLVLARQMERQRLPPRGAVGVLLDDPRAGLEGIGLRAPDDAGPVPSLDQLVQRRGLVGVGEEFFLLHLGLFRLVTFLDIALGIVGFGSELVITCRGKAGGDLPLDLGLGRDGAGQPARDHAAGDAVDGLGQSLEGEFHHHFGCQSMVSDFTYAMC